MMSLENGMWVQHASLGLGRVVGLEPKAVHVAFASQDARFATKLRLPMALSFLSPSAGSDASPSHLSDFDLDEKTGRYCRASAWLSHAEAVARFTESFPLGFADPAYAAAKAAPGERARRWRQAHRAFGEALGSGRGEALLAAGDVAGLAKRVLDVERIVRPLHRDAERASFEAGLKDPAAARAFFAALFGVLAAPSPDRGRFEALAAAAAALAPRAAAEARWPRVTLLPFVARPDLHVLLQPHFAREAGRRLGLDLACDGEPSWATYASLLAASTLLLQKLRPLGARDHVDVDAFMHAATEKRPRPKAAPGVARANVRASRRSETGAMRRLSSRAGAG